MPAPPSACKTAAVRRVLRAARRRFATYSHFGFVCVVVAESYSTSTRPIRAILHLLPTGPSVSSSGMLCHTLAKTKQ